MITERDVHRDFFSAPPAARSISFTPLTPQPCPASGSAFISRWRIKRRMTSLHEHLQFACSLIRNYFPQASKSTICMPGVQTLKELVVSIKQNSTDTLPEKESEGSLTGDQIKSSLLSDFIIGFSIGAMSIPQGMSYALLAGLGYQYGLYNNLIHPFFYFLLGSSRHAITGVSAVENLMVGESLDSLVGSKASMVDRVNAAILLSILSAMIFLVFRFARLAVMADLLADPVLSGFASAAAFLVGTSQLKHAFGMSELKSEWAVPKAWFYICTHLKLVTLESLGLCVMSVTFLVMCKWISKRLKGSWFVPGPLLLVVLGCAMSIMLQFQSTHTIKTVGNIPSGLPTNFSLPRVTWIGDESPPDRPLLRLLFLESLKLSSVFFVIHISIVKTIAIRKRYQIDVGQELLAFAATNFVGSFFQCYPTCTSISRSSVAEGLGARSGLQGPAASLVVLCTLLFLTGLLSYLPMPCLAAIVLVGVANMTEFGELRRLWNLQKTSWKASTMGKGGSSPDLVLWLVAFVSTLCLGATEGIFISVALSLIWIGKSILRPPFIELGRLPNTTIYRDKLRFPGSVEIDPHIAIYRIDAPLNFCNSAFLEREVKSVIDKKFGPSLGRTIPRLMSANSQRPQSSFAPSDFPIKRPDLTEMVRLNSSAPLLTPMKGFLDSSPMIGHPAPSPKSVDSQTCAALASPPAYIELSSSHPVGTQTENDATTTSAECPTSAKSARSTPPQNSAINVFILDCSSINGLDVTAIAAIERIVRNAMLYGVVVAFSNWKGPQRDFLWRANFYKVVPPQRCFLSNHDAYLWARALRCKSGDGSEISVPISTKANSSNGISQAMYPSSDVWHHIEARDMAGTLMSQEGYPNLTLEWDGLSALVPNVRVVHEVTADGLRDWEVSIGEKLDSP